LGKARGDFDFQPEEITMTNFVFYTNPTVTLACLPAGTPGRYSLATVAHLTGVHPDLLRYYCRLGLFGAGAADPRREPVFDDDALHALRRMEHYRRHHGVNRQALPLLRALEREVGRLEDELRFLRGL
jgi:hypothetical protein